MNNASRVGSLWARLLLVLLAGVTHVVLADSQAIVVTAVKGEVSVTSAGQARAVQKGTVIELPATIRTGAHSSLDLLQDRTTVSIAADTSVEIPATVSGPQLERIVQMSGNAFYSVGKRESKKLRVETPYLVAVIKGTQFNVAVQPEGATVSLFEGRLEVRAPDGSDVVDLNAGEIAVRRRNDRAIRVLRMDSGEAVRNPGGGASEGDASGEGSASTNRAVPGTHSDNASATSRDATPSGTRPALPTDGRLTDVVSGRGSVQGDGLDARAGVDVGAESVKVGAELNVESQVLPASVGLGADVDVGAGSAAVDLGASAGVGAIDTSVSAGIDLGAGSVGIGADVGVGAVDVGVDAGIDAGVDLGGGAVDVGVDSSLDVGAGGVDLGVEAGVDAGVDLGGGAVDVGVDTSLDVGAGGVDLGVDAGVDAGVDLGGGAVDVGVDTSLDVGAGGVDLGVDTGVDAGVDLGSGSVDLGTDLAVDTPIVDTGVDLTAGLGTDTGGVDVGADLGVGGVDLGVDLGVGSGGIDLGVDLGGSTSTPPPATAPEPPANGGLLGGILGGLGRRN